MDSGIWFLTIHRSPLTVRPHKRSAANLKRLTRFLDVTRESERSEGSLRSRCRFAALNPFMLRCYRLIADVECTGELKLVFHYSLFTIHYSLFTIHYSLFTIHYSLFTVHYSPFTIHYSPFTIHYSPFT